MKANEVKSTGAIEYMEKVEKAKEFFKANSMQDWIKEHLEFVTIRDRWFDDNVVEMFARLNRTFDEPYEEGIFISNIDKRNVWNTYVVNDISHLSKEFYTFIINCWLAHTYQK